MRWRWSDDPELLRDCLAKHGVLGLPTESSYALGVDPRDAEAVAAVFRAKGRAATEPLGVVVANADQAKALGVDTDAEDYRWASSLWPAALNVLLEVSKPLPAMSGAERLSVRIPEHSRLVELLVQLRTGLTATSANSSGAPPIVDPAELDAFLASSGVPYCVVDDGVLPGGLPSTMVLWRARSLRILREGRTEVAGFRKA